MGRKRKKKSRSKGISINLAKWAVALGALGYMTQGLSLADFTSLQGLTKPLENLKANWQIIVPAAIGVTILGKVLGRWAPRAGVKGLSIKAF